MAQVDPMTGLTTDEEKEVVAAVSKTWWLILILGIVSLVVGVLVVLHPAQSTWVIAVILAIYLVVTGIVNIVRGFSHGLPGGVRAMLFIAGGIALVLGVLMFRFAPEEKIEILGIFVGVWFLFSGILQLVSSSQVATGKGWAIFAGIVYLLAGLLLLVTPWAVSAFVWICGIWLVVLGIFEIIAAFQVKSAIKKALAS